METDIETKYCQSCGMPLGIEGITEYGTNSDGTGKATQLCPFWPRRIIPFG